jgi:hypothetical protein
MPGWVSVYARHRVRGGLQVNDWNDARWQVAATGSRTRAQRHHHELQEGIRLEGDIDGRICPGGKSSEARCRERYEGAEGVVPGRLTLYAAARCVRRRGGGRATPTSETCFWPKSSYAADPAGGKIKRDDPPPDMRRETLPS